MNFRDRLGAKLTTAKLAADAIRSDEKLYIGMLTNLPIEFAKALVASSSGQQRVHIYHYLSLFPWADLDPGNRFKVHTLFATPADRAALAEGRAEYLPVGSWAKEHIMKDHPDIDTAVVSMSPPDENGFMSFGSCLWLNKTICQKATRVIAEIDEGFIRTFGDNYLHISEVDQVWVRDEKRPVRLPDMELPEDTQKLANTICSLVVNELINDGDCIQIGTGDVSAQLCLYLGEKNDIGIQTELIPPGVMQMVNRGVINGSQKVIAPGKVVGAAVGAPDEELLSVHMHPQVELWDFAQSDDIRLLVQNPNFKAINNAMHVDLTGQVTAEAIGPRMYSGPGGQSVFAISAAYSPGGASITVLPSTSLIGGELKSRILTTLLPGTPVTVMRTFVDYVVTEYGIAKMSGRTLGERIEGLISIAHPDFRDTLHSEAKTIYGI